MPLNRREFNHKLITTITASLFYTSCFQQHSYLLLSSSDKTQNDSFHLAVYDSRTQKVRHIKVPCLVHGISQHPLNKELFLCTPKFGDIAFLFNAKNHSIQSFSTQSGFLFYGHGVFSPDGKQIITINSIKGEQPPYVVNRISYQGMLSVRKLSDLNKETLLSSYGNDPHDIKVFQDQLVIANGGEESNIAFVNIKGKELIKKLPLGNPAFQMRHLHIDKKQLFALTYRNGEKATTCHPVEVANNTLIPYKSDSTKITRQLLSAASDKHHLYTTSPDAQFIQVWSKKEKRIIETIKGHHPTGLSSNPKGGIYAIYTESVPGRELKNKQRMPILKNFNGRHLLMAKV